jgi:hypothetical protein
MALSRSTTSRILALIATTGRGQLVVDGEPLTPEQLVQNVLLGGGVTISNITFNGVRHGCGERAGSEFHGTGWLQP